MRRLCRWPGLRHLCGLRERLLLRPRVRGAGALRREDLLTALEVLSDLSERMQVLFFTHHARLVELAEKAVPEARRTIHELGS